MSIAILAALALSGAETHVLMLGNSHTAVNNLPVTLGTFFNTDGGPRMRVSCQTGGFLDDIATEPLLADLRAGKYDVVVLQAAKMSSSHKYSYPQTAPIALAKAAIAGKAKVFWFPEWPRKNWKETDFILGIYGADAKAGGGTLIPIPRAWDLLLAKNPKADLWQADGNHASPEGTFLAAGMIYLWMRGGDRQIPDYVPPGVDPQAAVTYRAVAKECWRRFGAPPKKLTERQIFNVIAGTASYRSATRP